MGVDEFRDSTNEFRLFFKVEGNKRTNKYVCCPIVPMEKQKTMKMVAVYRTREQARSVP